MSTSTHQQDLDDEFEEYELTVEELIKLSKTMGDDLEVWSRDCERWVPAVRSEYVYRGPVGFSSPANPYAPINAIAMYHQHQDRSIVLAIPPPGWSEADLDESLRELTEIRLFDNEEDLLLAFLDEIEDSDILSGWNSRMFDMPYIGKRVEAVLGPTFLSRLSFPEASRGTTFRDMEIFGRTVPILYTEGREHMDYMILFKKFEPGERESYRLELISEEVLPDLPKLTYEGTLYQLYLRDFNYFLRYNVRDTEVLKGFEEALGFVALATLMVHAAGAQIDNINGTVRLSDYSIYNYCRHELDVRVPDIVEHDGETISLKGADVLDPVVGLHEWIGSVDVSSLYPSSIRSVNMSPDTIIGQFSGFSKDFEEIRNKTSKRLTLHLDNGGQMQMHTETAAEWFDILEEYGWTISGYGTVFDGNKNGVIPTVLSTWYAQRKAWNKRIEDIDKEIVAICSQYKELT